MVTPKLGYSAVRLCSFSRELVAGEPVELSNEGQEDSVDPCAYESSPSLSPSLIHRRAGVWNVVFNLPIPGWLPETTSIGQTDLGVKYHLHATAKFTLLNDHYAMSPWAFATLCTPFRSRTRYAQSLKRIYLRRFVEPPSDVPFRSATNSYFIKTPTPLPGKASIPAGVLEKIQVIVATPEFVDMQAGSVPVILRLRTNGLEALHCKRIQVKEVVIDINQKEKYRSVIWLCSLHISSCRVYNRSRASPSYLEAYPVPPRNRQPPIEPLLAPHPVNNVYEYGLATSPANPLESTSRAISLLPPGESGRHQFGKENYAFADDDMPKDNPDWYTVEIALPFVSQMTTADTGSWWDEAFELFPTVWTPLFHITHEITLSVTLSYDNEDDGKRFYDRLTMRVPITMVHTLPPTPSLTESEHTLPVLLNAAALKNSYALPAYSQLYDEEGERKIDYSIPLPLYEPPKASTIPNEESDIDTKVVKSTI
jgi:hypothetical protein